MQRKRKFELRLKLNRNYSVQRKWCPIAGLVDFNIGPVNSVLNLLDRRGKWNFLRNYNHKRTVMFVSNLLIIRLVKMTFGLVHANCSLPKWEAVKLTFFAPWTKCNDNCAIMLCELPIQSWPPFQGLFSYMKFAVIIIFVFVFIDIFVVQLQCHSFIYYKQVLLTPSTLKFNGMQIFYRLSSSQW